MAEPDDRSGRDAPDNGEPAEHPRRNREDTVFPDWYRAFWRTLLGFRGRR